MKNIKLIFCEINRDKSKNKQTINRQILKTGILFPGFSFLLSGENIKKQGKPYDLPYLSLTCSNAFFNFFGIGTPHFAQFSMILSISVAQ